MKFYKGEWVEVNDQIGQVVNVREEERDIYTILLKNGEYYYAREEEMQFPQGQSQ